MSEGVHIRGVIIINQDNPEEKGSPSLSGPCRTTQNSSAPSASSFVTPSSRS